MWTLRAMTAPVSGKIVVGIQTAKHLVTFNVAPPVLRLRTGQ